MGLSTGRRAASSRLSTQEKSAVVVLKLRYEVSLNSVLCSFIAILTTPESVRGLLRVLARCHMTVVCHIMCRDVVLGCDEVVKRAHVQVRLI